MLLSKVAVELPSSVSSAAVLALVNLILGLILAQSLGTAKLVILSALAMTVCTRLSFVCTSAA